MSDGPASADNAEPENTHDAQTAERHIPVGLTEEEIDRIERHQKEFRGKTLAARLPGETGGFSVYLIAFDDGCRYYGHTSQVIAWRVDNLCNAEADDGIPYLFIHDQSMGKTLSCLASGLPNSGAALSARRKTVAQAQKDLEWEQNPAAPPHRCPVNQKLQNYPHALMPHTSQLIRTLPPYNPDQKLHR